MTTSASRQGDASFLRLTGGGPAARRFLVTGAAGFIGSHLCDRLLADGHWVYGVDSFDPYYDAATKRGNLAAAASDARFRLATRDLASDPIDDLVEWSDGVFHLAGQPGVRPSWGATFDRYTTNNVLVTQRLLDALVRAPRPFVQASSSSVYGHRERERLAEDEPLMPASPYGMSKMACEHLARIYAHQHDLHEQVDHVPVGKVDLTGRHPQVHQSLAEGDAALRDGPERRPDLVMAQHIDAGGTQEAGQRTILGVEQVRLFQHRFEAADEGVHAGDRGVEPVEDELGDIAVDGGVDVDLRIEVVVERTGGDACLGGEVLVGGHPVAQFGEPCNLKVQ